MILLASVLLASLATDADSWQLTLAGKYLAALKAAEDAMGGKSPYAADTLGWTRSAVGDCTGALAAMDQA